MIGLCRSSLSAVALFVAAALPLCAQPHTEAPRAAGHWEGTIEIPNHHLALAVDLAPNGSGDWIGSLTIPGATDIPLAGITVGGTAVRFAASLPERTSFEGTLAPDGRVVSGTVSNAEGGVPFQLTRAGEANVKLPPPSSRLTREFEGVWEATVAQNGTSRRIRMILSAAPDGTAVATLISVDKGNLEIPVTAVVLTDKQLQLDVRSVAGTYRGTLDDNGEVAGQWTEPTQRFPLTFRHVAAATK
jgi:hypothetical protein